MKIKKYTFAENLISVIIAGLLSELLLLVYAFNILNNMKQPVPVIKPVYEKIIEYADDDPLVIKKPIDIIEETEEEIIEEAEEIIIPEMVLNANLGRVQGPIEQETYYNLPMENVVAKMRALGYDNENYPYYVREDGVKMLGDFIMVAADLNKYPRGTIIMTSLGQGMICDMCEHGQELDIAVNW